MAKKQDKKKWIIIAIIVLVIASQQGTDPKKEACAGVCVDLDDVIGTQQMKYGANEIGSWYEFSTTPSLQGIHEDAGTQVLRAWVSAHWWLPQTTYPLRPDGSYDWANFDLFFDAITSSGFTPMVLLAHGDRCGGPRDESATPFDFSGCESFGVVMPSNSAEFVDYAGEVTQHLVDRYGVSQVNTWYFEILNEPFPSSDTAYYELVRDSKARINSIAPGAKVGGAVRFHDDAFAIFTPDFFDHHFYPGNLNGATTDEQRFAANDIIFSKASSDIAAYPPSVEFINGEYNYDVNGEPYVGISQNPVYGSWYISALINQIKAGVAVEMVFEGTCRYVNNACMGMWGSDGVLFDNGKKKMTFINLAYEGATLYFSADDTNFDVLATGAGAQKYITIVNRQNAAVTLDLQVTGADTLSDLLSTDTFDASSGSASISFSAYETKFLSVSTANTCTPSCACAADICTFDTCSDGCGGTCSGEQTCSISLKYNTFKNAATTFVNGGDFATFIEAGNTWVSS